MKIAVDAMGGDNAPAEIVRGAARAAMELDATILLVGREKDIKAELNDYYWDFSSDKIQIINAAEVIENEDKPVHAVRTKKDSSMVRAVELVRDGEADAMLSAGNTGALMTASLLRLGRIEGIDRPAIVTSVPVIAEDGRFEIIVDAGANSECKPQNLMDFAYMGSVYYRSAYGKESPSVGLINIGVEETKGTPTLKETYQLLKMSSLNFVGNVEAREVPNGPADVLVCDGFVGNVVLKLSEGVTKTTMKAIKDAIYSSAMSKAGGLLIKGQMQKLKDKFNYETYGSAPILGVNGLVFKMHGSSSANAVYHAVHSAARVASGNVVEEIRNSIKDYQKQ